MTSTDHTTEHPQEHKGFGIDELRFRRAYALAKYEMAKIRFSEDLDSARQNMPSMSRSGITGKILGSLNYFDYALIAFRVFSKLKGLRKKKK